MALTLYLRIRITYYTNFIHWFRRKPFLFPFPVKLFPVKTILLASFIKPVENSINNNVIIIIFDTFKDINNSIYNVQITSPNCLYDIFKIMSIPFIQIIIIILFALFSRKVIITQ